MKLICPSCSGVHSAEAWANDPVARQCLKLVGEMPHDLGSRCFAYLALFRPEGRSLQWKKVLRLLSELKDLAELQHIQWEKRVARPNSSRAWGLAMERVIENPPKRLPLKTHGYLRAIAYEIADETDRQVEVRRNKAERTGNNRGRDRETEKRGNGEPGRFGVDLKELKKIRETNMARKGAKIEER